MALGHCPDCKGEMSDSAVSCTHCGSKSRPVKYRYKTKTRKWKSICSDCEGVGEKYQIEVETRTKKDGHLFWDQWHAHLLTTERWNNQIAVFTKSVLSSAISSSNRSGSERASYDKDDPYAFQKFQQRFVRVINLTCSRCQGSGEEEHTEVERNMYEEEL